MEFAGQRPPAPFDGAPRQQGLHGGQTGLAGLPSDPPHGPPHPDSDDSDSPLFQTDEFRVWCMKVIPCTKRFVHDWTVCPFAHAGEKAVRRDPRTHTYTGIACPDMKKMGSCIRGDRCPYAHNVFEYWLHPTRYRTQLCNDGPTCRRSICFFAHSLDELRVPACKPYVSPEALARASLDAIQANPHPLGAQLPLAQAGGGGGHGHGGMSLAAQQQAALAALSRPIRGFEDGGGGGGGHGGHPHHPAAPSPFMAGPAPPPGLHTHVRPDAPRLSMDYGALPRWSDCPPFVPGTSPGGERRSSPPLGGAGGYGGPPSEYGSACSTPARLSLESLRDVRLSGGARGPPSVQLSLGGEGLEAVAEGAPSGRSSGSGGRSSPRGSSRQCSADVNDAELAHSLATLKIALTQQNAAATSASNHEVVINTLHQILREAVAQQGGSDDAAVAAAALAAMQQQAQAQAPQQQQQRTSEDDASAAAAAAYAALASSMAAFGGGGGFPGANGSLSVSDVSGDTPGRMSLEAGSPTAAAPAAAADGGAPAGTSTYRLSQDLVHALN